MLARRLKIPVYITADTHHEWQRWVRGPATKQSELYEDNDKAHLDRCEHFHAGERFTIGDIEILPFTIPHDAADPVGFVFRTEGLKIAMATDLGYMPAFKDSMSDAQIAELVSFLRQQFAPDQPAWTDLSSAVSRIRKPAF